MEINKFEKIEHLVFLKKLGAYLDTTLKRILPKKLFWIIFCGFGFFFPIYRTLIRELPPELPKYFKIPNFKLIDENGRNFTLAELEGKIFIANFIFTSCASTCPGQSEKMQLIQKRVRGLGSKIGMLSFTVDPENDSSQVLFKYARKYNANPYIWHFLTGSRKDLESLLISGFKVSMGKLELKEGMKMKNPMDSQAKDISLMDIAHSEKFILVDSKAIVRGFYSTDTNSINKMMIDIGLLANRMANTISK